MKKPNLKYKLHIRPFRWEDIVEVSKFLKQLPHGGRNLHADEKLLKKDLQGPRMRPLTNLFIAEAKGRIYGIVLIEPELNIGRCVVHFEADSYMWDSCAEGLLDASLRRVRELNARAIHMPFRANEDKLKLKLLKNRGFIAIRRYSMMRLENVDPTPQCMKDRESIREMRFPEEVAELTALQNIIFREHFGYSPNTSEEIEAMLTQPDWRDIVLFSEDSNGRITSYAWAKVGTSKTSKGKVSMMGTHPLDRSKGLGKIMFNIVVSRLAAEGVKSIELEVDSENHKAVKIYSGKGFREFASTTWMEKRFF